jgi:hypothetical protein
LDSWTGGNPCAAADVSISSVSMSEEMNDFEDMSASKVNVWP